MTQTWQPAPSRLAELGFIYDPFGAPDAEILDFDALNALFVEPETTTTPVSATSDQGLYTRVCMPEHSVAVIAAPGAGKTALRRMVEAWLYATQPAVCGVRLSGLQHLTTQATPPTLAEFTQPLLASITATVTAAILARPERMLTLQESARNWWWAFLSTYPAAEILDVQLQDHADLYASFVRRTPFATLFAASADLADLLGVVRQRLLPLGYERIVLFVDGIDTYIDTAQADQGTSELLRLLGPLLRTQGIFRMQGIAWKLFLPQTLAPALYASAPARGKWLGIEPLVWTPASLDILLAKRLEWASLDLYNSLEAISETPLAYSQPPLHTLGSPLHHRLAELVLARQSTGSVRDLLRLSAELFAGGQGLLTLDAWRSVVARWQSAEGRPTHGTALAPDSTTEGLVVDGEGTPPICDLEIRIECAKSFIRIAAMTFIAHPGSLKEELLDQPARTKLQLKDQALIAQSNDHLTYGPELTKRFFAQKEAEIAFVRAAEFARGRGAKLRIRLAIQDDAPLLHAFKWELLQYPSATPPRFLCLDERMLFSRYLPLRGGEGARRRARRALVPVVAVASPEPTSAYYLAPLPIDAMFDELGRVLRKAPRRIYKVSLARLADALAPPPDVMILICHGQMVDGKPYLYLHDSEGAFTRFPGAEIIEYLANHVHKPVFWVLASCQSAGSGWIGDEHTLAALGPQLARVGVGAVLAFADSVQIDMLRTGLPHLLKQLQPYGQIELAVAAMRSKLNLGSKAWWQSVFYLGLDDGQLWR